MKKWHLVTRGRFEVILSYRFGEVEYHFFKSWLQAYRFLRYHVHFLGWSSGSVSYDDGEYLYKPILSLDSAGGLFSGRDWWVFI